MESMSQIDFIDTCYKKTIDMNNIGNRLTLGIELIDDPNWIGGTLYLRNLVICLSRLPLGERPNLRLLGAPMVIQNFLNEYGELDGLEAPIHQTVLQSFLQRIGLNRRTMGQIDLIYPGFGASVPGATTVRWIPDFQHRYLPRLFSEKEIAARDRSMSDIAERPGVVVLSSDVAASDFKRFFPEHRATPKVWHFCSILDISRSSPIDLRNRFGLPDKYLYLPNQFWAHKNHITVLKALHRLRKEHEIIIPLVCTGAQSDRRNLNHFSKLMQFVKDNGMLDQIYLLGLIDREDQINVLRYAAAVIQPSLFEGWSTVVEDVRATGRPIFLSDIPVHREQSPNKCSYFLPESEKDLSFLLADKWELLQPGPDMMAEEKAGKEIAVRMLESAKIFLEILTTARRISST